MIKTKEHQRLIEGEYVSDSGAVSNQAANARRELMRTTRRLYPHFFEMLRKDVYPKYVRLAQKKKATSIPFHEFAWTFDTWATKTGGSWKRTSYSRKPSPANTGKGSTAKSRAVALLPPAIRMKLQPGKSGELKLRPNELTSSLIRWALTFNVGEEWILDGAMRTLWLWHKDPKLRKELGIDGFYPPSGGSVLLPMNEHRFRFEYRGWDPQQISWVAWNAHVKKRFNKQLQSYEKGMRKYFDSRQAVLARSRYSTRNFEYFVLFQFGSLSVQQIAEKYTAEHKAPDLSTIYKGVKTAAALLDWHTVRGS